GRSRDVDVVEADRDVAHASQTRSREDDRSDRILQVADDADAAFGRLADALLVERLIARIGEHLRGLGEDGRPRIENRVHQEDPWPSTGTHGFSPSSCAIGFRASRTISTCSSKGMPSASAPATSSSRCTPRAKALSFIFLRTVLGSTALSDLSGLTSAHAMMKPHISSTALSALRMLVSRGTSR